MMSTEHTRLPEFETADKLGLTDRYEAAVDRFFQQVQEAMVGKKVSFRETRAAIRMTISDELADSFEEWWGEDEDG